MAYARVVSFEDVDRSRIDELKQQIEEGEPPEGLPASEIVVLYDADGGKSLAIVFFETEEDYRQGDATLEAMPAGDTPGRRTSVTKYEVAARSK
ncbi:MAG TPA: hypothetical protein VF101_03805 [Gaiellaceae bacterium]